MSLVLILIIFVLLLTYGGYWQRNNEIRWWNKGVCPTCKVNWQVFDYDSQGGRGYVCKICEDHIWVSYKVDKQPRKRGE